MRHPTLRKLWLAFLASKVAYLAFAFTLGPTGQPSEPEVVRPLFLTLAAVCAAIAVGTHIYRRRFLVAPIQAGLLDPNTPEGFAKMFRPFILILALTESISIYGLVLAFISRQPLMCLPFVIPAFVLMYLHRPTAPDLSPPTTSGVYRPPPLS